LAAGTDPNNPDTDGDGILDGDDTLALCNENGVCDVFGGGYREDSFGCSSDCREEEGKGSIIPLVLGIILILLLISLLGYYLIKKKKKKKKPDVFSQKIDFRELNRKVTRPIKQVEEVMNKHSNINQLHAYVRISLERGVGREEIKKESLEAGWTKEELDDSFSYVGKIAKRKQAVERLYHFVKLTLQKGTKEADIKGKLLKAGWSIEDINKALTYAKSFKPVLGEPSILAGLFKEQETKREKKIKKEERSLEEGSKKTVKKVTKEKIKVKTKRKTTKKRKVTKRKKIKKTSEESK